MFNEEYLPHCLTMGIGGREFWDMTMADLRPYLLARDIRDEEFNRRAWVQGRYFYDALCVALSNAFRNKGQKVHDYLDKPYEVRRKKEHYEYPDEETRKGEELVKANMMAYADMLRRRFEAKKNNP